MCRPANAAKSNPVAPVQDSRPRLTARPVEMNEVAQIHLGFDELEN